MDITEIVREHYKTLDSAEYLGNNIIKVVVQGSERFYSIKNNKLYLYEPKEVRTEYLAHLAKFKSILRECKINNIIE